MHKETSLTLLLLLQHCAASVGGDLANLGYLRLSLQLKSCWHPQLFPTLVRALCCPCLWSWGAQAHLGCLQAELGFSWCSAQGGLDLGVKVVSDV